MNEDLPGNGLQVLVVDNNPVLLKAISAMLVKFGCSVSVAVNGLDALEQLKKFSPDIIFTDLVMPLVGGEQLCKILRKNPNHRDVFLVVISGILLEDIENILAKKYYDVCIAKGNLKELRAHIADALQQFKTRAKHRNSEQDVVEARIPEGLKASSVTEELLLEQRHLHRILENLEEGIVELNTDGLIVSLNEAACDILGVSEEEVIGTSMLQRKWGEHRQQVSHWLEKQRQGVNQEGFEILEDTPLMLGERVVTASFLPARGEGDNFGLCILRDISRQYQAEKKERELDGALRLMTKMDAMSCMAGGIAHDFNNLLTVICGNLDILKHSEIMMAEGSGETILENARTAAYIAVDLTRKISNFSPFGIVSRKKCIFEELVTSTVRNFSESTGATCDLKTRGSGSVVSIDEQQIGVAIDNILQNSWEAVEDIIEVETGVVQFESPVVISGQYVPAGRYASVTVRDHGNGIDREHLQRIFDPYFSTKTRGAEKGMGLGLTVVYATLRNHGGYVVVESSLGEGTSVSCYLPDYGKPNSRKSRGTSESRLRVLIVEHDPQLIDVERIMLEFLGHEVKAVKSVVEAVDVLKIAQQAQKDIQVVMIDPAREAAGAHENLRDLLLSVSSDLKIIITGGSVMDPVMQDCRRYGYANALPKPFTMDSLRHVLESVSGEA